MGGYSDVYSDLYDPAFPQSVLDVRADAQIGGAWTPITPWLYQRDPVSITRGHPDEASSVNPAVAALTVNNRDGRFSPRNPVGPWYGQFGRNTPLRLSLPDDSTCLRLEDDATGYAWCPDRASLHIAGDIEVQVDMQMSGYTRSLLISKGSTAAGQSWNLGVDDDGTLRFTWFPDGVTSMVLNSTLPIPLGRIAVKATLAVSTGTATFYTAPTIAGSWTQLGTAVVKGATSIFVSTAPLQIGANADLITPWLTGRAARVGMTGKVFAAKVLSGIGGSVVASPVFAGLPPGTAPFADAQGNLWAFAGPAEISDRRYRFHGEAFWPPRWDVTGRDVSVPVQASGMLRRLGAPTAPPLQSPFYRAYALLTGAIAPVAYWPCEDGSGSTSFASALPGGNAMTYSGSPQLASDSSFICSKPLPVVNGSNWTGTVPAYTTPAAPATPANVLRFLMKIPSASPPADSTVIARMYTTGTVAWVDLIFHTGGALQLTGYNASGVTVFDTGSVAFGVLDQLLRVSIELTASGSNIQYNIVTLAVFSSGAINVGATVAGSVGQATSVRIAPAGGLAQAVIGHVSVQGALNNLFDLAGALGAWSGEAAALRIARLCYEEGLNYRIYGHPADSVAMGPQTTSTLVSLLQECENADQGLLTETRQALAIGYRTRVSLLNQAAAVALSYTAAHLSPDVLPSDDDQYLLNDVIMNRTGGGSSARAILAAGTMSVQDPPNGIGEYQSGQSQNLYSDAQLGDAAGWLLHVKSVDELRYPSLPLDLARSELASLTGAIQDTDIGDRVTVSGTPSWLPPDGVSQLVRGYSEQCYGFTHRITWVCAPESPYRVAVLDDPVLGKLDTDGSTIVGNPSATATSLQVATTNPNSPLWTTNPADFPFDITAGGERITVTNITGASSPQTFTVTRSVNGVVKAQSNGTDVRLFQPMILSM